MRLSPTPWSSSAPRATWPTSRSFRRCCRWSAAASSTCRSSALRNRAGPWSSLLPAPATAWPSRARWMRPSSPTCQLLRYVDGDYDDPRTFDRLRQVLGECGAPAPSTWPSRPACFRTWSQGLAESGCATSARIVVEKPFGRDLASARELNADPAPALSRSRDLPHRSLPRQGAGAEPDLLSLRQHFSRADLEPQLRRATCRSRWPRPSVCAGEARSTTRWARYATWCRTTCCRSSACSRWSRRRRDVESVRDEKAQVFRSMRPLDARNVVRGQYRGYRAEPAWRPTPTWKPLWPCGSSSTAGAGQTCPSTFGPASACQSRPPKYWSSSSARRGRSSPTAPEPAQPPPLSARPRGRHRAGRARQDSGRGDGRRTRGADGPPPARRRDAPLRAPAERCDAR